jgi:hypothetical protein
MLLSQSHGTVGHQDSARRNIDKRGKFTGRKTGTEPDEGIMGHRISLPDPLMPLTGLILAYDDRDDRDDRDEGQSDTRGRRCHLPPLALMRRCPRRRVPISTGPLAVPDCWQLWFG